MQIPFTEATFTVEKLLRGTQGIISQSDTAHSKPVTSVGLEGAINIVGGRKEGKKTPPDLHCNFRASFIIEFFVWERRHEHLFSG